MSTIQRRLAFLTLVVLCVPAVGRAQDALSVPGARITDYMNDAKEFIAITDASVWDMKDGRKLLSTPFLNVNRSNVEFVVPT